MKHTPFSLLTLSKFKLRAEDVELRDYHQGDWTLPHDMKKKLSPDTANRRPDMFGFLAGVRSKISG